MPHSFTAGLIALALPLTLQAQQVVPSVRTFLDLEAHAEKLVQQPYTPPQHALDPFFDKLEYDGHRQIQFIQAKALFNNIGDGFRVEFSHPGWMFKKPIGLFQIADGQPAPVPYSKDLFFYGDLKLPEKLTLPQGFSGWKLLTAKEGEKARPEFLTFQGASYFRAVTTKLGWGLSARGVAINTVGAQKEEFPDFTHFWFVTPKGGDKVFQFYALLQGESVVGAYQFEITPGEVTFMRVTGSLFLRKPVTLLGLAPFSSMFWFGENTHPKPADFRPEVHDSDGLLIEPSEGPVIWRPLDNSRDLRHSVFTLDGVKGFGLMERDRDFQHFEDLEAKYHQRVSVWVDPVEGFGRGSLHLIEIPTGEETWDNVVTMWQPEKLPTATEPLRFSYNMSWLNEKLFDLAKVTATRWGLETVTRENPNDYLFVLDFTRGKLTEGRPADWLPGIEVNLTGGAAKLIDKRVMANPQTGGWRAFFRLDIAPETKLLEMTCDLMNDKAPLSERWNYQWRR
jgi:glucans biosynthesis protein